jgi:cyclopropane fatty-acyl-phospholipid synthase-like methyltransferase
MIGEKSLNQRKVSYGQKRTFRGLEDYAIGRRLAEAKSLIYRLVLTGTEEPLEVLELGCGYWGKNLTRFQSEFKGVEFTGVDLSVAKEGIEVRLIEADITNWRPTRKYDVVLSLAVVEHLLEPTKHFNLIADCLKPNGLAGLTTPTPQAHRALSILSRLGIFDRSEILDHKMYLTESGITQLAQHAGLLLEEYRTFSFGMNQWALLRKTKE